MSARWVCACWSLWSPCGVWRVFIFRTISQPSISHPSGVSHRSDKAFYVYSDVSSKKRELSKICLSVPKGKWWWSNETIFLKQQLAVSLSHSILLSIPHIHRLLFSICPGLHQDPVLEACTTQMRMSALSTMTWSRQRAAVWPRNPLRYPTLRYTLTLACSPCRLHVWNRQWT